MVQYQVILLKHANHVPLIRSPIIIHCCWRIKKYLKSYDSDSFYVILLTTFCFIQRRLSIFLSESFHDVAFELKFILKSTFIVYFKILLLNLFAYDQLPRATILEQWPFCLEFIFVVLQSHSFSIQDQAENSV